MAELPTEYQKFIHLSRYARYLDDQKRRETWEETVDRYVSFMASHLLKNHEYKVGRAVLNEIRETILNLEVMPSMRALMTAGTALDRCNVSGYNCSYIPIDDQRSFDELLYILMCGTGVGFSVERQFVAELPVVADHFEDSSTTIVVEDSKEGWAKAFREFISMLYGGRIPKWDVSKVRPAGARLKTFGGRASGPEPLVDLFKFSIRLFQNAKGRKLNSLECHDLVCKIAEVVVVGGVRRSALISLSNLSDERMRNAKSGAWYETEPQRALANNSVCYTEKPDMGAFMSEWISLYQSKSGERGIFSRVAADKQVAKNGRREVGHEWGTNPCCVTGETLLLTKDGNLPIEEIVGKNVEVWNGNDWAPVVPFVAGEGEIVRVTLSNGAVLDCTWNHRWCVNKKGFVETEQLNVGDKLDKYPMPVVNSGVQTALTDAYSQGFYSGDGTRGYNRSLLYSTKFMCANRLVGAKGDMAGAYRVYWKHGPMIDKSWVPLGETLQYRLDWLAGLLDSDGVVTRDKNGSGFQISSVDHNFLENVRLMLATTGVNAKVTAGHEAGYRDMPDGAGGVKSYFCQQSKRILIGNSDAYNLVSVLGLNLSRLKHDGVSPQRDARRYVYVKDIAPLDKFETVYCVSEPATGRATFNGIVTGNSEIILRPYQFCNLNDIVCRATDTDEDMLRKIRVAAILGTFQSSLTDFKYLRRAWKKNTEEERLLGVSLTGIMDSKLVYDATPETLERWKQHAVDVNKEFAKLVGIPQSTAITCVKPSGTVSQLVDCASGIHTRHSKYYIRRVRGDKKDPLTSFMELANIPVESDVMKPEATSVFSFPIKAPENSVTRNDMTAIQQLELWIKIQRHWCEHKPSVTISVRENEWMGVGAWVWEHMDEVSGVSFLPHSDHTYRQAPYEECDEATYNKLLSEMPTKIDWKELGKFEDGDRTTGSQELSCTAGQCELVDIGYNA